MCFSNKEKMGILQMRPENFPNAAVWVSKRVEKQITLYYSSMNSKPTIEMEVKRLGQERLTLYIVTLFPRKDR